MAKPYLSVIIPAYNEAERLPLTLVDIDRYLSRVSYSSEILVVNDGSTDGTATVVRKMSETIKNLKLIDNEKNQGKGAVVRQGMLLAQGEIRLFLDADNSTSVDQFEKMIPYFNEGVEVVIGSRALKESKLNPPQPLWRRILGKIGNLIIQLLLLPGIKDTQCGFKAFREEAAEKIFSKSKIAGFGFDIEALALAKKFGFKIKEVPVVWVNDTRSKVKGSTYLKVLLETIKIRLWLWFKKYDDKEAKNNGRRE